MTGTKSSRNCRKQQAAAALLAMALATTTTACGDNEDPASHPPPRAGTTAGTASSKDATAQAPEPTDGRLTTTTGTIIEDYGDRRQRQSAVRALDRLQDDFRAGRMTAACSQISDFLLNQFTPPKTQENTPCPQKLEAYATARERRGAPPPRMRLLWVRHYTGQAGIWVDDGRRDRHLRIQMSSMAGRGWELDLGPLGRPDILAAKLVGADDYVDR